MATKNTTQQTNQKQDCSNMTNQDLNEFNNRFNTLTCVNASWNEYSKLVLKELEDLNVSINKINSELMDVRKFDISEIKYDISYLKNAMQKIDDLQSWKNRIDDVASPTQLSQHIRDIEELKHFKTKSITVFAVVQFFMAIIIFFQSFFKN
jgi:hypothetical protein